MIQQARRQQGFTIIELSLAMSFVAVLLLTIAMTVIQMGQTYNRGMAIKEVNQLSRDISDDLRRSVQGSGIFTISPDGSEEYAADYATASQPIDGYDVVTTGRVCLGNYSYIWNTATALETNYDQRALYANGDAVSFAKVADTGKKYCQRLADGSLRYPNIVAADTAKASELLESGDRTIRLLDFSVVSSDATRDELGGQQLYTFSYRLGTGETSAMEFESGQPVVCLPPNAENSNFTYCNVQQFNIVLRAGNTVKKEG